MKNLLPAIIGILISLHTHQEKNIFTDISIAQRSLQPKPTIVYTYVTWCGGNADDMQTIHPVLKEFRSKYNLIILIDSTRNAKTSPLILDLKPDGYVLLNTYYPTCFLKKKEYKKFAKDFNHKFNMNEVYMGPGSSYIMDCYTKLIKIFNAPDRVEELTNTLLGLPENCGGL